jgi:hypothetical protein
MNFDLSTIQAAADVSKRIAKIGKSAQAVQKEIHEIAVQTLAHIAAHGDYTLAVKLLDNLPNGQRVKALAKWYNHFSNGTVSFNFDPSVGWKGKLAKTRSIEDFDLDAAESTTFADLLPEKGYSTLTIEGFMAMLKRTADKDGKNEDGTYKVLPAVRDIAAKFYADLKTAKDAAVAAELAKASE